MNEKINKIAIAQETLAIIEKGFYLNAASQKINLEPEIAFAVKHSKWYTNSDWEELFAKTHQIKAQARPLETTFEITSESTLQAAERLTKDAERVFCLNFASAKNPGGGFQNGAQAQEESLARSSALYPCIAQMTDMYRQNRQLKTCLYNDDMIYSPLVPVFRDDAGRLSDQPYLLSFLTAPAVNAGVVREREPENIHLIAPMMLRRLEKVLAVAMVHGYRTLLLGAWGCGVFRNDARDVAGYFHHQLKENPLFAGYFEKVVFAIYGSKEDDKRTAFINLF